MATIATAYVQIVPSAEGISGKLESELSGASSSAGTKASSSFGSSFAKGVGTVAKVGAAALAATTTAVTAFGASAVSAGADFDSAMSQVAATMGDNADKMVEYNGETVAATDALRDFAQEMGSSTAFSATEAAEALNYMALAGYDVEKSINMLPNVLSLASAGAIDLADASEMVTGVSNALGLDIEETTTMVDQMAVTASSTGTSVTELGQAMSTIGATAASLVDSAESASDGTAELATMIGVLADNNIKGAEGGTHLRNILLSLQDAAVDGSVAMGDFSVEVYDSEGNMRSMIDIVGDMQTGLEGMDQASKDAIISGVFNKTDLASVNALLNTSSERFDELTEKIGDSKGAAEKMAEVQLDNLSGDVTLFKSALEGAKIAVSDELTPSLRELVSFGTDGLSQLTEAFKSGGIDEAVSTFGNILTEGLTQLTAELPTVVEAGATLLESLVSGLTSNASTIVSAAVSILNTLISSIGTLLPMVVSSGLQIVAELIVGIAEAIPNLLTTAISMLDEIKNGLVTNLPVLVDAAIILLEALVTGITDNIGDLLDTGSEITQEIQTAIVAEAPKLMEAAGTLMTQLVLGLIDNAPSVANAMITMHTSMLNAIASNLPELLEAGITMMGKIYSGVIQEIPHLIEMFPELISKIKAKFTEFDWSSLGKAVIDGIKSGISSAASSLGTAAKNAASTAYNAVKSYYGVNSPSKLFRDNIGVAIPEGIAVGIEQNTDYVTDAMKDLADDSVSSYNYKSVASSAASSIYSSPVASNNLNGATFTINESIELGGTKLKDIISKYTIQQIGNETRAVKLATGGYY